MIILPVILNSNKMYGVGNRIIVLVVFGGNYTFSNFSSNLRDFGSALNCPYRQQLITFYFGNLSNKIDCDYQMNLVECVNQRILADSDTARNAHKVSSLFWLQISNISVITVWQHFRQHSSYRRTKYYINNHSFTLFVRWQFLCEWASEWHLFTCNLSIDEKIHFPVKFL